MQLFLQQAQQMSIMVIIAIRTQEPIFLVWNSYNMGQAAHQDAQKSQKQLYLVPLSQIMDQKPVLYTLKVK